MEPTKVGSICFTPHPKSERSEALPKTGQQGNTPITAAPQSKARTRTPSRARKASEAKRPPDVSGGAPRGMP